MMLWFSLSKQGRLDSDIGENSRDSVGEQV